MHTGQHFDDNMSDVFFRQMNIKPPKYNLGLDSLSHGAMIGRMIEQLEIKMQSEQPEVVLLIGDTNSTLAGAIAARKLDLFIAHIEAGVRSYNKLIPEEANRLISDHLSDVLFCSNRDAIDCLNKEGVYNHVYFSGDVMKDAAMYYRSMSQSPSNIVAEKGQFVLATCHRAENTNDADKLRQIFAALDEINNHVKIIMPLHPRTRNKLKEYQIKTNIDTIEPVGYLQMLWLLENSKMVITDSGGVPKEAFFFGKPCLVMRPKIEWTELVTHHCTDLIDYISTDNIVQGYKAVKDKTISKDHNFYGDGNAADFIIAKTVEYANQRLNQ